MITKDNLSQALMALGYTADSTNLVYSNTWSDHGASITVDFDRETIAYPTEAGFKVNRATTCNFTDPENFVVLACVSKLFDKGYRPESLELEREWKLGHERKSGFADICISDEHGETLVIIECKTPGKEFRDEWQTMLSDGGQLFSYWQQERATQWLVLFTCDLINGEVSLEQKSISCSDDENYKELAKRDDSIQLFADAHTVEQLHEVWIETYSKQAEPDVLFGKRSTAYNPLAPPLFKGDLVDFKAEDRIVNQFEEILRHNNVSDKENAFNRLIALFIAKLQDEISKMSNQEVEFQYRQGRDTYESLQDRLQKLHSDGMKRLMREEVFYVSNDEAENIVSRYTGQNRKRLVAKLNETFRRLKFYTNSDFAFKDVHNEQLFLQNGKILVEMVKLFQPYRIVQPAGMEPGSEQFLGDLFEQLLNHGFKQNEGQFFTPLPITRFIWKSLPLDEIVHDEENGVRYPRVIDYACGAGHFLTEGFEQISAAAIPYDPDFEDYLLDSEWVRDRLVGVEKDYRLARTSRVALYMHGAGNGEIVYGDGLENYPGKGIDGRKDGGQFDILTSNPPYSVAAFKPHLKLHDNKLEVLDEITDNGSEIETLFVERASQLVRPGGYAAIILPSSILDKGTNSSFVAARDVLLRSFELVAIARFGSGTFAATGTNVAILFMRRFSEVPSRDDSACDFVDAVFGGRSLDGWRDAADFETYLDTIKSDEAEYRAFVERAKPWQEWEASTHFAAYARAFARSADLRNVRKTRAYKAAEDDEKRGREDAAFYRYAHAEEKGRLRVFALVCDERTLVVNSPTQTAEIAAFLGYKWSNRKGSEGIQPIDGGGVLYSDDQGESEMKICDIIRSWFAGDEPEAGDLSRYYYYADTRDFIDFSSEKFDKALRMPRTYYKPREFAPGVEVASLGDIAKYVTSGATKTSIELSSYVTTENMVKGRLGIVSYEGDAPASDGTAYKAGDTLVSNIRPYLQKIWLADHDGACSKDVLVFRSKDAKRMLPEFLHILLWQEDFFAYDMSTFTGTGRPRGDKNALLDYRVPIPDNAEQRAIITEFKRLAEAIDSFRKHFDSIDKAIEQRFTEMFGSYKLGLCTIGDMLYGITAGTNVDGQQRDLRDGEYGVLKVSAVTKGFFDPSEFKAVANTSSISMIHPRKGDLLFCRANTKDIVGASVIVDSDYDNLFLPDKLWRLDLADGVDAWFMKYLISLKSVRSEISANATGTSSSMKNISMEKLRHVPAFLPPYELQKEFAEFVSRNSVEQSEICQQIEMLIDERDSLLDKFIAK